MSVIAECSLVEQPWVKKALCLEVNNNIMSLVFRHIGLADQHILNLGFHQVLANTYSV